MTGELLWKVNGLRYGSGWKEGRVWLGIVSQFIMAWVFLTKKELKFRPERVGSIQRQAVPYFVLRVIFNYFIFCTMLYRFRFCRSD